MPISRPRMRVNRLQRWFWCTCLGLFLALGTALLPAIAQVPRLSPPELMAQGQQEFDRGNFAAALEHWQQATQAYQQARDAEGAVRAQLQQAQALLSAGFYQRAQARLAGLLPTFAAQPPSELEGKVRLQYGNLLRLTGDHAAADRLLQASLAIANQLQSPGLRQSSQFHLGNLRLDQQRPAAALTYFQQAASGPAAGQLVAQLRQLQTLQRLQRWPEAIALLPAIEAQVTALPAAIRAVYTRMEFAALLVAFPPGDDSAASPDRFRPAAQLLAIAQQQAHSLGHLRAEATAIGQLGGIYEQTGQWATAQQLTQTALQIARRLESPEWVYQWEWQLGRILKAAQQPTAAIAHYTTAVNVLRSLRQDLTGLAPDVQFSFRDRVEPVYRELVDLLLQPDADQAQLKQARQVVESLQLAELNNFFREACLEATPRQIDDIDPTAATIYPVMLRDRLEVILAIPGQPLRHVATPLSQPTLEAGILRLRTALRRTAFPQEYLPAAQQLYDWLIRPIAPDLQTHPVKTLVFVPDGSLRSVPMAALYDGQQYLVEQYQIAITPSLQLFSPRPFQVERMRSLAAGLSEGAANTTPLPGVKQEIELLQQKLPAQVLLNQTFTTQALKQTVTATPFTLVHLATHGQFSSAAGKTYIQTWDGRLTVDDLQEILNRRSINDPAALELLVLSACQTAEGDQRAALGMAGLAIRAGARSTLATLWAVNDASTVDFITDFYQALWQPHGAKAAAVRAAQLQMLRSPKFKHPYFWAPFILVGNWL